MLFFARNGSQVVTGEGYVHLAIDIHYCRFECTVLFAIAHSLKKIERFIQKNNSERTQRSGWCENRKRTKGKRRRGNIHKGRWSNEDDKYFCCRVSVRGHLGFRSRRNGFRKFRASDQVHPQIHFSGRNSRHRRDAGTVFRETSIQCTKAFWGMATAPWCRCCRGMRRFQSTYARIPAVRGFVVQAECVVRGRLRQIPRWLHAQDHVSWILLATSNLTQQSFCEALGLPRPRP
jgi:hypothetical protein